MRLISPSTPKSQERYQTRAKELNRLLKEIKLRWPSLTRTNLSILDLLNDPKLPTKNGRLRLYYKNLPFKHEEMTILNRLKSENPDGDLDNVDMVEIPNVGFIDDLDLHGTVYLPYPYVVPGGRFQEMYAWDSFFIALGLLRDNETRLARNMLDNYIYQIEHYGKILNGNRSYYLTRSQLPFLTPLIKSILPTILDYHQAEWLTKAIRAAEQYYSYWTTGPHLVESTGLSRFFDSGPKGSPPPEITHETDPRDGSTAHDRVKQFFRENYHLGIPDYDISEYYDYEKNELTEKFMDNDRAMRESGFDTSTRFGPFNSKILDFNPVCLNSLLYLMEVEIAELYIKLTKITNHQYRKKERTSKMWIMRSEDRKLRMKRYNWDEELGCFLDYDYVRNERKIKMFGTGFLPLWTGLANTHESEQIVEKLIKELSIDGGISTSNEERGDQWDKPYVWAPLQLFAVEGLLKYGFDHLAQDICIKFCSLVFNVWLKTDEIWEKYDGVKLNHLVKLKFGYPTNEVGFGWTNAVFIQFYDYLKSVNKLDEILNNQYDSNELIESILFENLDLEDVDDEEVEKVSSTDGWIKICV